MKRLAFRPQRRREDGPENREAMIFRIRSLFVMELSGPLRMSALSRRLGCPRGETSSAIRVLERCQMVWRGAARILPIPIARSSI